MDKHERIKQKAVELGFLACGISAAGYLVDEKERLRSWLAEGMNGEMEYMARNHEKRLDPRLLHEGTKSVISVLLNYYPKERQLDPEAPVLSKYAYGTDYHFVLKDKLNELLKFIHDEIGPCNGRAFVDSAPVLDKAWAVRSGLGWIGKNTNLISVEHGSFFFIGELLVDLELKTDDRIVSNHCGNCTRCIDACPTKAIVAPYVVDARRCISYQTIEQRGEIDKTLEGQFKDRVFGCDICQDVCPWNLKSEPHEEPAFDPHPRLMELSRLDWQNMDESLFAELFRKSAVMRTKYSGLMRNLKFIGKS
ncbi:tRNA epoxyqueuosine(34) reductase QueG [Mangrovibacterium diazotrophicum]|uniref:Epoxyqueuosine reductase n=1 Tax=Mangrovibacterium diazotrophicum TaxID=1261403 RepID=A0A419W8F6_9BACT|nr:tRNA epoxyqueuosine(34) reductase QueG [Mangrovibacterium diazotrophicum]RKD91753.1 epoxyqueuosine reductase [Mangrovibacterium diazotrophicum]